MLFYGVYILHFLDTKIMLAYSCLIVILPFSSIIQLVELFRTHKNQIFEVNALTGNSASTPKFHSFTGFLVKTENNYHFYCYDILSCCTMFI